MKNSNDINDIYTGQWHLFFGAAFLIWLIFLPPGCNKKNFKDPVREKLTTIIRVDIH